MSTDQWLKPNYVELNGSRVHYLERGNPAEFPVLLIHGSPISSFCFRHQLQHLAPVFRVIAPDLLGFGLSDGPAGGASFVQQAAMLRSLIEHLELTRFSLVVHDWGGPIAAGAVADRLADVRDMVLINTTLFSDFRPPGYWGQFVNNPLGALSVTNSSLLSVVLPTMMKAARRPSIWSVYNRFLQQQRCREAVLALERLQGFEQVLRDFESHLSEFVGRFSVIWGHPDPYFGGDQLLRLRRFLNTRQIIEIPKAGHFPQEDAPTIVTSVLLDFLRPMDPPCGCCR